MTEVVVVINRMAVTKIPTKWKLVLEILHHIFSIYLPSYHSLLAYIIRHNIIKFSLYGTLPPHIQPPKMILHLYTWYHGSPVSYIIYDSIGKNTLLPQLNQPFQDTETIIKDYIPTSGKIIIHHTQQ